MIRHDGSDIIRTLLCTTSVYTCMYIYSHMYTLILALIRLYMTVDTLVYDIRIRSLYMYTSLRKILYVDNEIYTYIWDLEILVILIYHVRFLAYNLKKS